jgi:hypothetical protein
MTIYKWCEIFFMVCDSRHLEIRCLGWFSCLFAYLSLLVSHENNKNKISIAINKTNRHKHRD